MTVKYDDIHMKCYFLVLEFPWTNLCSKLWILEDDESKDFCFFREEPFGKDKLIYAFYYILLFV